LKTFAAAAHIPNETDNLSISYKVESPQLFFDHLKEIDHSSINASELASYLPVKAVEKFDSFLSDDLLNTVNGHDHLDVEEAKQTARQALAS